MTKIPSGYQDWKVISVAHEAGKLNSLGIVLGNDIAIKAYREGALPFPDGAIIAALHYSHVPSDENNKVFGDKQSFVPGAPTSAALLKTCFPCHEPAKATDLIYTHYTPE